MKQILSILFLFVSLSSFAQLDAADSLYAREVTISLKGKYHGLIYELMNDRGSAEAINYVNQVAIAAKSGGKTSFDTAQIMTVTVPYKMVISAYYALATAQEGITAKDNAEMKVLLFNQLYNTQHQPLLQAIMQIDDSMKQQREAKRQAGIDKIWSIEVY